LVLKKGKTARGKERGGRLEREREREGGEREREKVGDRPKKRD